MSKILTKIDSLIIDVNKTKNDLLKSGECFNIFSSVNIEYKEQRHSLFLANLLDPMGSHGQGDIFLKKFINLVNSIQSLKDKIKFKSPIEANVHTELYMGPLNLKNHTGGRIDISIHPIGRSLNKKIFIENKIEHQDEREQLFRYHNYDSRALILYLTIDGSDADAISTFNNKIKNERDYYCISYDYHILKWLESCQSFIKGKIKIIENINQYMDIINEFSSGAKMKNKIQRILIHNIETTLDIMTYKDDIYEEVKSRFLDQLNKIGNDLELDSLYEDNCFMNGDAPFLYKSRNKNWNNLAIGVACNMGWGKEFYYGIFAGGKGNRIYRNKILNLLNNEHIPTKEDSIKYWPFWNYFEEPYRNWDNSAMVWKKIIDGTFKKEIFTKMENLKYVVDKLNMINLV